MNKERFCPECGEKIEADERFCQNCGSEIPVEESPIQKPATDTPVVGAGARANIMGGIHQASTTHTNVNTSNQVNTSNVDNSSTVNNNTTYVMNEKKKEFCEVCGNPLEERHAKCPKCGKEICLDCKVKGKPRCIECEKKALNEYRVAFQQLLLTTNGNLGVAGRQMMDQKARELDVEDAKATIEKELTNMYKPAQRAVQPEVVPVTSTVNASKPQAEEAQKGVGSLDGRKPLKPKNNGGGGNKVWMMIVALLVVVIAVFVLLNGDKKEQETPVPVVAENTKPADTPANNQKEQAKVPEKQVAPVETPKEQPASQPVVEKEDPNYDAGMKAYNAKNGLDAISHFKKSGSAKAYYMLGVIYENGCGNVSKNAMMARKNFKKAAELGSAEAKAKL